MVYWNSYSYHLLIQKKNFNLFRGAVEIHLKNVLLQKDLSVEQHVMINREIHYKKKSKGIAYLIWMFFGVFGGHRYYIGDIGIGIAMTLTGGGGGLWFLIDVFFIGKRIESKNMDLKLKKEQEITLCNQKGSKKLHYYGAKTFNIRYLEVDEMTGEAFEVFLQSLLKGRGYKVRSTSTTGDYGADLILSTVTNNKKIASSS